MANATMMSPINTIDVLNDVAEFLEDYSDVKDGDEGAPEPNKAMSLLGSVEREIERLKALPAAAFTDDQLWNMVRVYHGWKTDEEMINEVGYSMELYVAKMRLAVEAASPKPQPRDS